MAFIASLNWIGYSQERRTTGLSFEEFVAGAEGCRGAQFDTDEATFASASQYYLPFGPNYIDFNLTIMPKFIALLLCTFMTTASISGQEDFANLRRYHGDNELRKTQSNQVVLIGNSITDGWYKRDTAFFDDNKLVGRGISGQTSMQLLLRFRPDVVNLRPEKVVIHIGTNDVAENTGPYSEDFTVGNITSMVDIAQQNDIEVILASVLPADRFNWRPEVGDRSEMIVSLNKRLKELADERDLTYIDYHSALKNDRNGMDKELAPDGVHPSSEGYAKMAELLLQAVR